MDSNPIIVALAGLPSAGKGTFADIAEKFSFKKFVMGDVIREECRSRGLEVNRKNSDIVMIELRKEKGPNAVAVVTYEWVSKALEFGEKYILIDGVRSLDEINYFNSKLDNLIVVGIHASPKTRLNRALARQREDDAETKAAFFERDKIELSVGIADVIALSDIMIVSEGTLKKSETQFADVIVNIIKKNKGVIVAER